ncbi:endo-1,4-beta-xylanase [Parvularcula dongshanensis]|uniref:Beta-xylanase n=1 Tax=Parvularcula dongshanensis TaxID=1173995 RepID=A0A840I5C8_9PROT|nr:endo-1,4-beta-xylanase [Parvularcula dongshanensis]MBB4659483.1 endo-1,4-beta-xylanase [Parvularcula dongshanensis]
MKTALAALGLALLPSPAAAQTPDTLRDAFDQCFLVGTALNRWFIADEVPGLLDFVGDQFSAVTAENAMKWGRIHPEEGQYAVAIPDRLVSFAQANDMAVVGHTLVWHSQTPDWVFEGEGGQPASRELLLGRMKDHIDTVVGRYRGRVHGWDVVNEAILDDGSWRPSKWREQIGPDFVEQAFRFAHEADPKAELYYNDYNMTAPGKRDAVVAMVKDLQAKGVPISGIGMQGHFGIGRPSMEDFTAALDAYGSLGLKVMITELDVTVLPWPENLAVGADISSAAENREELDPYTDGLPEEVARAQADQYAALFRELVARKDFVSRVTFWGVSDADNWKNNFPVRGRTDHPMLFDRDLQPKPAFDAVMAEAKGCSGG